MRLLLSSALLLLAVQASADTLSDQLRDCAGISPDSKRLACYDALSGSLDQRAERDFGREQQRISEEAPDTLNAAITNIQSGAYNKLIITLSNGQVWRQIDSHRVHWDSGDQVQVERAMFGSFRMKPADGGRTIRVKRIK
ncbi:hypothetical protein [Microbulbifer sp. SAOS-129_SWC]|uniref:hypothetical protein n=1 Tax=Microbulbifer sp. SAOS-129_SWC TaxID=3145235 RepID=UPI003216F9FC